MNSNPKIIARLAIITTIFVLISFCVMSLTLTESASSYNVSAVGDWGCNDNTKKTVSSIISKNPELVLDLGDHSYEGTADCWLAIVQSIGGKMKIAIGNHDDVSYSLLNQYMRHFDLSSEYYSFDYQNAHFLVLST